MNDMAENRGRSGGRRVIIALASCVLGAALILLASQMSSKSGDETEKNSSAAAPKKKPHRAWNIALGNVVVVAPELGLSAKALKGAKVEESKIAARLESQLQGLREFKKAVVAEVSKWTFPEIVTDSTTITCPILFVREGMDITTIVQWEKPLGQFSEKLALAKTNTQAIQQSQVPEGVKRSEPVAKASLPTKAKTEPSPEPRTLSRIYQIKHPTTIRLEPNFESVSIGKFPPGTKVTVIGASGDWVEVRADDAGPAGFIRREFVTPIELTQKNRTASAP